MSTDLFTPIKFITNIYIKPSDITNDYNDLFIKKLKNDLEGICTKHGYIKKDSIKIIKRSIGTVIRQHFNGNMLYELNCSADICNPVIGSIAKCKIKNKNTMGLLAQGFYNDVPVLEIIIPKISAGIKSEIDLDTLNIGDEILIEVCGKKFVLYDKFISIIGRVIKSKAENINNKILDDDDDELEDDTNDIIDGFDDIDENLVEEDDDEDDDDDDDEDDDDDDEDDKKSEEDEEEELDDLEEDEIEIEEQEHEIELDD
jgi:DNA-directed RNA polymerase subunit E'/Rpb7